MNKSLPRWYLVLLYSWYSWRGILWAVFPMHTFSNNFPSFGSQYYGKQILWIYNPSNSSKSSNFKSQFFTLHNVCFSIPLVFDWHQLMKNTFFFFFRLKIKSRNNVHIFKYNQLLLILFCCIGFNSFISFLDACSNSSPL